MERGTWRSVAAPGGAPVDVLEAPDAQYHESKRLDVLAKEDAFLTRGISELAEQTRAKNREFKRRLDALITRQLRCQAAVEEEEEARQAEHDAFKEKFQREVDLLRESVTTRVDEEFDRLADQMLEPLVGHIMRLQHDIEEFMTKEVPAMIEEQTGPVVKFFSTTQESFDIENAKIRKREEQLIERFETHQRETLRACNMEERTMRECFTALERDVERQVQSDDRAASMFEHSARDQLSALHASMQREAAVRAEEDVRILSSLGDTMSTLQKTVIEHFGSR